VISDHGFGPYRKSFDLNRWLLEEGYLETEKGSDSISWKRTRAYAAGFCGLYLNRLGREGEGIVESKDAKGLIEEIRSRLLDLRDPDSGEKILDRVYRGPQVYTGGRAQDGPDLVLGFSRGFRGSESSALGKLGTKVLQVNRRLWSGTHLNAARSVPGVFLSNRKIESEGRIRLIDLAPTIQARFGVVDGDLTGRDLESAGHSGSR
jgi:predicted AlkP superfamily phosphohydrolase/phosphomutase